MIVPADAQAVVGKKVLMKSTGETDEHRAAAMAAPIIAQFEAQIRSARLTGRPLDQMTAETLAERYRAEKASDSELASITEITDVVRFALRQIRQDYAAYGRQVREAGYDAHAALRLLPHGDKAVAVAEAVTGRATAFDAHLDAWKPYAGLKPRPLDQAISTIQQFKREVGQTIEALCGRHVQEWIDALINPDGEQGSTAKTVRRKLSELRNYWQWMQQREIVSDDINPFVGRRIREPPERRKTKDEARQRWQPEEVVCLWEEATRRGDASLANAIKIAAYSGARIEGVVQLKTSDILIDPDTKIRCMRMTDKTQAGDRHVPVHSEIDALIKNLAATSDKDGYLIPSDAKNKYGERSQPIGKRFGRLKTQLGFDRRYVFHSIRKTVTSLLRDQGCPEDVAADIVGHIKPTMTYGLYAGDTRMDQRAEWLEKAVRYPVKENTPSPSTGSKAS
jgi:integrase